MKDKVIMGCVIAMMVMAAFLWKGCDDQNTIKLTYDVAKSGMILTTDSLGRERAKTVLMYEKSKTALLRIQTQDETIQRLQAIVLDLHGQVVSATLLSNETSNEVATATEIILPDTVTKIEEIKIWPKYKSSWINEWEKFSLLATRDTTYCMYKVFNKYELTQSTEKRGKWPFKKNVMVSEVFNLNPNTETREIQTFTTECDCKNGKWFSLGVAIGAGVGGAATYQLKK